jgi:DNA invertase Pin-like site-specific DNA recombinase
MPEAVRAAQYVRMSTEHQQYSTENQTDAMRRYAEARRVNIVRTYSDAARSGLNLEGRQGLRELLRDVESGCADYTEILVYDVSRWGRFQDADESRSCQFLSATE